MKKVFLFLYFSIISLLISAADTFVIFTPADHHFPLIKNGKPCSILMDINEDKGVKMAIDNLQQDLLNVCGSQSEINTKASDKQCLLIGTLQTPLIQKLIASGKIDRKELEGKNEKYILQVVTAPLEGVDEALVITGSDKRGTIYGIYELSKQIGVSP